MDPEIQCVDGAGALYEAAAEVFESACLERVRTTGTFSVALAGGSTPKGLYSLLAEDAGPQSTVPWDKIHFFWGDERHVPPDDPESNYGMANAAMLSKVPVRPELVHRVQAELSDANVAADGYEAELRSSIGAGVTIPKLDLILLGLGADGHTASLFPGTRALLERNRLVVANWVDSFEAYRITMTLPIINAARLIVFMVSGAAKAEAVRDVLQPQWSSLPLPAALVRPVDGRVLWLLDGAAASLLKKDPA